MPIIVRKPKGNFTPAPEGLHVAVCCDVWEPWTEERAARFGGGLVDKTRLVWLTEEVNKETGEPYAVSQKYTFSLHEKANLCQDLESWRGRRFTDAEKAGFDLEKLIGVCCQLQIVHNVKDGVPYANVQAIVPLGKTQAKISIPEGYVRRKDKHMSDAHENGEEPGFVPSDDDVPF